MVTNLLLVEETMYVWGQKEYEISLYLPLNFVVNINCSKKIVLIKKLLLSKYKTASAKRDPVCLNQGKPENVD